MMAWRLAYSLDTLRTQVNVAWPNRSKVSDGTIGDPAHAATASDHNPNAVGVVCALDLTHDPAHGFDAHAVADNLRVNRHPDLKYIISNRRIATALTGWQWVKYNGVNPHDKHIHISVGRGPDGKSVQPYDDRIKWNIKGEPDVGRVLNKGDIINIWRDKLPGKTPPDNYIKYWTGKEALDMLNDLRKNVPEWSKAGAPALNPPLKKELVLQYLEKVIPNTK